uniref:Uncharacterized protein n=1 Tax=viral metagenome TaxID=1070528 RepID=A0A6C0DCL6_9ZZZZ
MTSLGAFNTQLIRFFEELSMTYPEERDIKNGLDAIQAAKKINPKLILDLFWKHVCKDLDEKIQAEDAEYVIEYAKNKIANRYNEMSPALMIFDRHWTTMSQDNQSAIWNYLKVLCILCKKARDSGVKY